MKENISKACYLMAHIAIIAAILTGLAVLLTGCGHNVLSYSNGKYLNLGIDPNTQKLGIQYINGQHLTVVERENTTLTVKFSDTLDTNGNATSTISEITYTVGDQVTGYTVDLEEVKKQ